MGALKQWVACRLGRHFFVEFEWDEGVVEDDEVYVWCLHCGAIGE